MTSKLHVAAAAVRALEDCARRPALLAIREGFILALPAVLAMNLLQVLLALAGWALPPDAARAWQSIAGGVPEALRAIFPYLLTIGLTAVLARRRGVNRVAALLTSVTALCAVGRLLGGPVGIEGAAGGNHPPLLILAIPVSFFTVGAMARLLARPTLHLLRSDAPLSPNMLATLQAMPAAGLTLFATLVFGVALAGLLNGLAPLARALAAPIGELGTPALLALHTTLTQLLWFAGLHGSNLAEDLLRPVTGDLSATELHAVFSIYAAIGGAGSTLALAIAGAWVGARTQFGSVCRTALPFGLFNVNELLIYGLPIAFNPLLLLPFLLAPLVNGAIALAALEMGGFRIVDTGVSWLTPPLVAPWLASGGSPVAVATQALCLLVDVLLYLPFVRRAAGANDSFERLRHLFDTDTAVRFLATQMQNQAEDRFVSMQREASRAEASIQATLRLLEGGRFEMYYQPRVALASGRIVGAEALLRLIDAEGRVRGPTFLPDLYRLGLSCAIDDKVTELVFEQVERWQAEGFMPPPVAINLDRDFLLDPARIAALVQRAATHPGTIGVEVTEHTFMEAGQGLAETVQRLRQGGVHVSLDDFGAGYSSLGRLVTLECDDVKLDRALVLQIETPRGMALVRHIVAICTDLGYGVVAEGVETEAQRECLREARVGTVQGYLTGRPMPAADFVRAVREAEWRASTINDLSACATDAARAAATVPSSLGPSWPGPVPAPLRRRA